MQPPFDIAADLDTPVSTYLKLGPLKPRFLLESVEKGAHLARYSFLGFGTELFFAGAFAGTLSLGLAGNCIASDGAGGPEVGGGGSLSAKLHGKHATVERKGTHTAPMGKLVER